ncbi:MULTISPECIES: type II secretion system protein [Sulfurimonas]|uniref:pilus assembly FimT family protein n=1 Tax=Sulfurimonas TaxID=202746 RepID=UPI0012645802|nr:type II secretion system protein [Sulfurimonas indica]
MKKAFTLLELVFVIVVIGILAALILPRTKTNPVQEAAVQVQSHIRYTQHLAMIDDKYDSNDVNWYKKRWQILFSSNGSSDNKWAYTIFADTIGGSTGNPDEGEIAINPSNPNERMTGGQTSSVNLDINNANFVGMRKMNLGLTYSITNVTFSSSCSTGSSTRLSFDHLGRPIKSNLSSNTAPYDGNDLLQSDCNITLTDGIETAIIQISPETGYARLIF